MEWAIVADLIKIVGGGAIGSVLTAWFGWGIEKQRMRVQRRRDYVDTWRRELLPAFDGPQEHGGGSMKYPFMRLPAYASLRPHLRKDFVKQLEQSARTIVLAREGDVFPRRELIEEIGRIEREWKLV